MSEELGSDITRFVTRHVDKRQSLKLEEEDEGEEGNVLQSVHIDYDHFEEESNEEVVDEETFNKVKKKRKNKGNLLRNLLKKGIKKIRTRQVNLQKSPKSYIKLPKNFEKKNDEMKKKYLKKLLQILESEEKNSTIRIKELKDNLEVLPKKTSEEIKKYTLPRVIDAFRKYMICRTLLAKHQLEMEEHCLNFIKRRSRFTISAIETKEEEPLPSYVCVDFFKDIIYHALQKPEGREIWNKIEILEVSEKELLSKFERIEKTLKKSVPKKKVAEKLLNEEILAKYVFPYSSDEDFEIVWQDDLEEKFGTLFLEDSRTPGGKCVASFLEEVEGYGLDKISPKEYLRFIENLVTYMTKMYNVPKERVNRLKSLIHRYIFKLIGPELLSLEEKKKEAQDSGYNENSIYLRNFSPIQMGVPRDFIHMDSMGLSFQKAIEVLRNIPFCVDPNSMMHSIKLCCTLVGHEAKEQCLLRGEKWGFAGDDFFPILTYIVVQCSVSDLHSYIEYVNKYATLYQLEVKDQGSIIRYFVDSFEGATEYVSALNKDELQELLKEKFEKKPLEKLLEKVENKSVDVETIYLEKMEICLHDCIDICEGMLELTKN